MPSPRWIGFLIGIVFFDWRGAIVGYILGWILESLFQFKVHVHFTHSNNVPPSYTHHDPLSDAYRTLGTSPEASNDDLRKAYRDLVMRYHPDRLTHLSAEERAKAEKTFKAINEAKERIWRARGI